MHRLRIPVVLALHAGILFAGVGALFCPDLPTWTSFSRQVDDQRTVVAKPELRDVEEEQAERDDGAGPPVGPAFVDTVPPLPFECRPSLFAPAAAIDACQLTGHACLIRGPPHRV